MKYIKNIFFVLVLFILFITSGTINAAVINPEAFQPADSNRNPLNTTATDSLHNSQLIIDKILIAGNKVTDDDIIRREMSSKPGQPADPETLKEDAQRIYNLGLFNKVDMEPLPTGDNKVSILVTVEERFYILPVPQGGFKDGEISRFWAGLNIKWQNFRGRNETLNLSFGVFYEPFINFGYTIPSLGKDKKYFASFNTGYSKNFNRSLASVNDTTELLLNNDSNYSVYKFDVRAKLGKYLSKDLTVYIEPGYQSITTSEYIPGRTLSTDGKDQFGNLDVGLDYDSRDSQEYTLYGSFYQLKYEKIGFGKIINFNRMNYDLRRYIPVKPIFNNKLTLAFRTYGAVIYGGNIPDYQHQFVGYGNVIRGWKDLIFEGENISGTSAELRFELVKPFFISGKDLPVIKSIKLLKDLSYKFGMYLTAFYDNAAVWDRKDNFFNSKFRSGFGTGLNFILPFGFVGRTDLGFRVEDQKLKKSIYLSLGASF